MTTKSGNPISTDEARNLPALIDVATAARMLGFSRHYVGELCARGEVEAVKFGRTWRVNTAALLEKLGICEGVNA